MRFTDSPEAIVEAIDYVLKMADLVAIPQHVVEFVDPSKRQQFDEQQRQMDVLVRVCNDLLCQNNNMQG